MVKILLVDDHRIIRDGIKALLSDVKQFVFVAEAENGEDALAKIAIYDIDLIIMDVSMPQMDGIETTKQLLEINPQAKILAFSMHDEEQTILKMLKAGALGYVLKNSGKEELIEAMEEVSKGNYFFSGAVSDKVLKQIVRKK